MASIVIETGARKALFIDGTNDIDIEIIHQDANGVPVDLTGMTISWVFTIGTVTLTATVGSGLTVTPLQGKIVLHFTAAQAVTLPQGLGRHRLKILTPISKTLVRGPLTNDT